MRGKNCLTLAAEGDREGYSPAIAVVRTSLGHIEPDIDSIMSIVVTRALDHGVAHWLGSSAGWSHSWRGGEAVWRCTSLL